MIELVRDPSGEVQLTSAPTITLEEKEMTMYSDVQSEDEKTITELKEMIQSLHSQIEVRLVYTIVIPLWL